MVWQSLVDDRLRSSAALWMSGHRFEECSSVQHLESQGRPRRHRGCPRDVTQQRDLPDVVPGRQGRDMLPLPTDFCLPINDHEEPVADVALADQDSVGGYIDRLETGKD